MASDAYYILSAAKSIIAASSAPFYVYILVRPNGEPFYVGCARVRRESRERIQDHERLARGKDKSWKSIIIRSIWKSEQQVGYRIAAWFESEETMFAYEMALIRSIGRRDLGLGVLVNGNDGGTGQLNPSIEIRSKISATKRRAFAANPELRLKTSMLAREVMARPEVREKLRSAALKQFSRPGASAAVSAQNLRRFSEPSQRTAAAERARRQSEQPGAIDRFLYAVNKNRAANLQKSIEVRQSDPTFRLRLSAARRQSVARKASFRAKVIAAAESAGLTRADLPVDRTPLRVWIEIGLRFGIQP